MEIIIKVNGRRIAEQIEPDLLLIDFLRKHGCYSVKRGCETANCGLCTVLMDNTPVLSCSVLVARADGHEIYTLEGLQEEASEFVGFIADQGADQCGFCNPGFVMNTIALLRENPDPTDDEIRAYLAGNLCRCSGYEGQLRGIRNFLDQRRKRFPYVGKMPFIIGKEQIVMLVEHSNLYGGRTDINSKFVKRIIFHNFLQSVTPENPDNI